MAATLEVTSADAIRVPWLGMELPDGCVYRAQLGIHCPTCGLTRSVITALHGELARSHAFHPAGLPLVFVAAVQAAMRLVFVRTRFRSLSAEIFVSSAAFGCVVFLLQCGR